MDSPSPDRTYWSNIENKLQQSYWRSVQQLDYRVDLQLTYFLRVDLILQENFNK